MKFIHLSDLHLGKRLYEFSMICDQEYILNQILKIIDENGAEGVLIAGDVYDKPVPPAEAVLLFDRFLTGLRERKLEVFVISGNHDSRERLAFGSEIMRRSGIHLSPVFSGEISPEIVEDEYGPLYVWMMPFLRPADVRHFFPEEKIERYNDAVHAVIRRMEIDTGRRNLMVAHQFVTGAFRSDSEDISVGGLDNVDRAAFEPFDYTALGHIHSPQQIPGALARYCGSPLKYSFSEANQQKSVVLIDIKEKGSLDIRLIPLVPCREMRELRGSYEELTSRKNYENTDTDAYIHVTLTDDGDIHDAVGRLRTIYPNIMLLDYDNRRTRSAEEAGWDSSGEEKSEIDFFAELFELQNGRAMDEEERRMIAGVFEQIKEGE
ncbi:MAG: exonuclease SbcCD subunit D [Anaerovoracaceae bacterium]